MRKGKVLIIALTLILALNLKAQIQLDIKGGFSNNEVQLQGISQGIAPTVSSKVLPSFGLGISYFLDNHFAIVSGVSYHPKGFNVSEGVSFEVAGVDVPLGVEFRYTEHIIDVPVHLRVSFPTKFASFYAKGGASLGIGLGGNYKTVANSFIDIVLTNDQIKYDTRINRSIFSGDVGLGAEFKYGNGKLIAEAMYQKAFTDKINDSTFDVGIRNRGYNVKVGYAFTF